MPQPNLKGLVYAAFATLPVGFVMFIGGMVSIAAKEVALGGVLMAAAIVILGTGLVLLLLGRNRARAFSQDMQARQQATLDATFRNYPGGGRLP